MKGDFQILTMYICKHVCRKDKYEGVDEYWVELDNECTYEEGINETVNQSMEMDVDGSAPFLQGPTNGPGHAVLDGSDSDEENEESDSNDDASSTPSKKDSDDDDDHDGDEKKARGSKPKKGKGRNGKQQSPSKEEPCEDRGILKMLIFRKFRVYKGKRSLFNFFLDLNCSILFP